MKRLFGRKSNADSSKETNNGSTSSQTLKEKRRQTSKFMQEKFRANATLLELPLLKEVMNPEDGLKLLLQKLELCSVIYNFEETDESVRAVTAAPKEMKRKTLLELVEYVNSDGHGGKIPLMSDPEKTMPPIVKMISANLFRSLPPQQEDYDPEEDEPWLDPAWPHMQVVYEFLLRLIVSPSLNAKAAKKPRMIDRNFCVRLLALFNSDDPRERDYLKTILHRIYGKFMGHRSFIRLQISNTFTEFVFVTGKHNGIGELLEILGSIINGFALPLKPEHVAFLETSLMPLHRPASVAYYHPQLCYCVEQYIEKDPNQHVVYKPNQPLATLRHRSSFRGLTSKT